MGFGWKLTRGRGARQTSLYVCFFLAVGIVFLGKAQTAFFDQARATLSDWTEPALTQVHDPLILAKDWIGGLSSVLSVYRENMQLKQENAELRRWQQVALSLESRVKRYETLLNTAPNIQLPVTTARVIGESNRPFIKTVILNAGSAQKVEKGQAVLDQRGLLGRIYVAGETTSWVILLTDHNSRIPVVIEPSHRRAILSGDDSSSPQLELDAGDGSIAAGDRVISTSDGGLMPPDLPVGIISPDGNGLRVSLFAQPGTTDYVHIANFRIAEPPPLRAPFPASSPPTKPALVAAKPAPIAAKPAVEPARPPLPRPKPEQPPTPAAGPPAIAAAPPASVGSVAALSGAPANNVVRPAPAALETTAPPAVIEASAPPPPPVVAAPPAPPELAAPEPEPFPVPSEAPAEPETAPANDAAPAPAAEEPVP